MKLPRVPVRRDSKPGFDKKLKIWSGRSTCPLFHEDVSIGRAALYMLLANPKKVIQICAVTGKQLTCEQMAQLSIRVAQSFKHKLQLQQEDVIGIIAGNTTYLTPVVLGTFLFGGAISPMYPKYDEAAIKAMFSLTKPKVIFCDAGVYNKLKESLLDTGLDAKVYTLKERIEGVAYVEDLFQELDNEGEFRPSDLVNGGNQRAAILSTSGTTGTPKGVCISHHQLLGRTDFCDFMKPDDVIFTFSSLHWITGLWVMIQSLTGCQTQIITDLPFTPAYFLELVEKYRISQILLPPAYASLTAQCPDLPWRDLSSVRNLIIGGAAMLPNSCKILSQYFRENSIGEGYGLTELASLTNMNWTPLKKVQSVGRLNPNLKAKVLSSNGKRLGVGEVGEIYLWRPAEWMGYLGNQAMTRQTMDSNRWIKTGDMGYFDEDDYLYICGRQKDILRHRHFLIHPKEIEDVIFGIPGVMEACVFGVPDQIDEDVPTAAIVKSPGSSLNAKEVCQTVAKLLPDRMHLRGGVYFLEDLPRTTSGKVQRHKLLKIVEELVIANFDKRNK